MFPQFIISLIKTDMNLHFVIECVTRLDDIVRWGAVGGGLVGSRSINKVDVFLIKTKIYTLLVSYIYVVSYENDSAA